DPLVRPLAERHTPKNAHSGTPAHEGVLTIQDATGRRRPLRGSVADGVMLVMLALEVALFHYRVIFLDDASFPYDIQAWHYPQLGFLGNALMRGELPLWNPHVYGGMSFVGDVQAALFYPVNLVFLGLGGWIYRAIPYRLI